FSRQPVGDLFARPDVVVIQMDQHRSERQPLLTSFVRAAFRDLVETPEQSLEMIRNQLPVLLPRGIAGVVDRAQRARSALLVKITAETLGPTHRAGANIVGQLALFTLELGYHAWPPEKNVNCSAPVV